MAILIGTNKIRTAVFISGSGSNLKSLIKFSKKKKSPISINLIISSNSNAKGLSYGKIFKIKRKIFKLNNKISVENKLLSTLKKNQIDNGKILNIHPSLLPKYKGLNTHQRALDNNEKYSGCTVHFVNSKLDSGKIILQKKVKISKNENKFSLARKILVEEHRLYPKAILKIFSL